MWRVQGFVGRVLYRYHGSNTFRLPQNHHVEDEVLNSSAALSTTRSSHDNRSQKEEDEYKRRKQKTFQFSCDDLPRYSALDAVGWGAVAVLLMQVCKRVHSRFSSGTESNPNPGAFTVPSSLQRCGYRILLDILSRRDVLPGGRSVLCLNAVPENQQENQALTQSTGSSSSSSQSRNDQELLTAHPSVPGHQQELLQDSPTFEKLPFLKVSSPCSDSKEQVGKDKEGLLSNDERLSQAALNLKHFGDSSVPVILNIIGLENVKHERYKEAFSCFQAAAQEGYSKAQFNTAVCYEKGQGVKQDKEKALYFYKQAAANGHKQAQYRYAKLVLASGEPVSEEELSTVISLLEEAAAAGITKAQLCLASIYSGDPVKYGCKSIKYLRMAAESGDSTALLFLGQCYGSGFEIEKNSQKAAELYKQAAEAGNKQARSLLRPCDNTNTKNLMRPIQSAPCFPKTDCQLLSPLYSLTSPAQLNPSSRATFPLLAHSWSTGNLQSPLSLPSLPINFHTSSAQRAQCKWTVGMG